MLGYAFMRDKIEVTILRGTIVKIKGVAKRLLPELIIKMDEDFLDKNDLMEVDDEGDSPALSESPAHLLPTKRHGGE